MKNKLYALLIGLALLPVVVGPAFGAWPLTRRTTYVANTAPAIKAADLNAMQDVIGDTLEGTVSHKGIVVDGTGGAAATARAGTVRVSAADSGTEGGGAAPLTGTVALGEISKGLTSVGWALVDGPAGTLYRGVNIYDTTRTGVGQYTVDFNVLPSDSVNTMALVSVVGAGVGYAVTSTSGGRLRATVVVLNLSGAALDETFRLLVFAE